MLTLMNEMRAVFSSIVTREYAENIRSSPFPGSTLLVRMSMLYH